MSGVPRMAWVPWRIDDHLALTRGWPPIADGIYCRLLFIQWQDGSFPSSERELRAITGATPSEWKRAWPYIESHVPVYDDGRRRNPEIADQREEALRRYRVRVKSARTAAEARWGTRT